MEETPTVIMYQTFAGILINHSSQSDQQFIHLRSNDRDYCLQSKSASGRRKVLESAKQYTGWRFMSDGEKVAFIGVDTK